ncbi:AzlD domain-containing protein [Photobacterium sanguinicancri]|uniref:AzlD domain-containing protein n=1 Tax=Photobacterium sanguinicancri TaxID=875932 RepID=A0AAW7Y4Z0_9GAMM|nr:AzlD domain-containing protein [Photobacterium sanguinicancri]KXI22621.1 branched-chain amino acid ABC transporter [Photobacterium sanguinicancri]MDO6543414.1 AzlD domain-containing protein [Photobacterium sanguinicancri]
MIMLSILAMTAIVFFSRYVFLEPRVPLKLNNHALRLLSYSSPAILTAIWAPIIFLPDGELSVSVTNPYLLAAIITALLVWKTGNVLLSIILSMGAFLFFNLYLFS